MKLLVTSINYAPEPTGTGPYSAILCEEFAQRGHDVQVVCGYPFYPQWQVYDGYANTWWMKEQRGGVDVYRCPIYVPASVNGLKRLLHYLSFTVTAWPRLLTQMLLRRPDVLLCVAPTLMAMSFITPVARLLGIRTWIHIQDFEVEAGFATNQLKSDSLVGRLAKAFENFSFWGYDFASTISPAMLRKLKSKVHQRTRTQELRNWAELDLIKVEEHSTYRDTWAITTPYVALYSGSVAKKQGIDVLIEVARLLAPRGDITIIICGNGPEVDDLRRQAGDVSNLQFHDLQPMAQLSDLLALATVHLLPQKKDAADLVLPSKMANMLASGRPIVTGASAETSLAQEIYGCGVSVEPEDASAMADAIAALLDDTARRASLGANARRRAESDWAKQAIMDKFEAALLTV
ncbi:WcaI family glycosyltransferase [Blastomonas sp. AAP53]|uniref:WcaI family glycosyltransferase n=1 Tax=Blastomonas sp. AAP53 TaxID=1248760 RepID=UPI0003138744|nr:WcaI family glycosyltransferase [Blastomonas sp. AAP53]